jgi:phosphoenolpyruvate carboxykinase (GTP)
VSEADMKELLSVDKAGWMAELEDIKLNHYPKFGAKMPKELSEELIVLEKRLNS